EELPAALATGGRNIGKMIADRDIERDAAAHAVAVHGGDHAPDADTVAIVAPRVVQDVGHGTRPGRARGVERGIEFVVLDIRRTPEGQASAPGPGDFGPVIVGEVVVEPRILLAHVLAPNSRRRRPSYRTSWRCAARTSWPSAARTSWHCAASC